MTTLLQINASLNKGNGQSSQLANQFVAAFHQRRPEAKIVVRDVAAAEPVPQLNAERFGAFITKPEKRSAAQRAVVAYSDILINELKQADVIVLGLPMYNFGVPSQLKAYFDQDVFPICTPLGFDPAHPFPFVSNLSLSLAVELPEKKEKRAAGTLRRRPPRCCCPARARSCIGAPVISRAVPARSSTTVPPSGRIRPTTM